MGQKMEDKVEKALIKDNKAKNSPPGKVNFDEFCAIAGRFVEVEEDAAAMATELREAFRLYDREAKGYITVKTLRDILHELDDKLSSQELDMIIEEIDSDGSGTVDFDGLCVPISCVKCQTFCVFLFRIHDNNARFD